MRRLYTGLMYALVPYILLRLWWKSRRSAAYRQRIAERFSIGKDLPGPVDVWLHAVSLGEAVAATPLIEQMLAKDWTVLVTTMTPTGSQHIRTRFQSRVSHQYVPYDLPVCVQRFIQRIKPRLAVIMETELWPNLIYFSDKAGIPILLINARLSDRAFEQYKKIRVLLQPTMQLLSWVGAQSALDADRYQYMGVPRDKIAMMGNMKFDLSLANIPDLQALKTRWGQERPVWIAASTHEDEEAQLLAHLPQLQREIPHLLLLIAPRRPERFQAVYALVQAQGWRTGLRSQFSEIQPDVDVIVLDSMGELLGFYALSDYAFVGGSLVPIGGHNVLEPIAMRVPVCCGPFMQNAKSICIELSQHQALYQGQSAADIASKLIELYKNPEQRQQQIANATQVLESNRGAVERYWQVIASFVKKGSV